MTLEQIEKLDKAFLDVEDVSDFIGSHPQSIRCQAHDNPALLGFPVVVVGSRVKIPKVGFVKFCKGENV